MAFCGKRRVVYQAIAARTGYRAGSGMQEYLKVGRKDANIRMVFVWRIPVRSFS
jgi:hypothetical protein